MFVRPNCPSRRFENGRPYKSMPSEANNDAYRQIAALEAELASYRSAPGRHHEAMKRLQYLCLHNPAVIYTCDADNFGTTFVSENIAGLLGYQSHELLANPALWAGRIHPEDQPRIYGDLAHLFENFYHAHEYRFRHKNGAYRWIRDEMRLVREGDGGLEIIGTCLDISAHKQAEKALKQAIAELNQIFNTAADGMLVIDADFNVRKVNSTLLTLFDLGAKEAVGNKCRDIIPGPLCGTPGCPVTRILAGEKRLETETEKYLKNGAHISCIVTATPFYGTEGELLGIVEDLKDITGRKKTEDALRESEARYRDLFENSSELIQSVAADGRILYANRAWQEALGYTVAEIPALSLLDTVHPDSQAHCLALIEQILAGQEAHGVEAVFVSKNGRQLLVEGSLTGKFVDGKAFSMRGIFRDVTEKRRLEEQLLRAGKLESVATLAGGIAHDFNNLLTAILGNISLARLHAVAAQQNTLAAAEKASFRARDLVQQLMTFARGGQPLLQNLHPAKLLKKAALFALSGSNVKCGFAIPDNLWPVRGDKGQLTQVIHNLVTNADQAMPDGGTIKVTAENISLPTPATAPALPAGNYVKISVEDHGVGIPAPDLARIFDPYFTTQQLSSQKGTGLGLAICHAIIEKHAGRITAESNRTGTVFHIYLPAYRQEKQPPAEAEPAAEIPAAHRGKVLVMDDEEIVLSVAGNILGHLGFETAFASNGAEAIAMFVEARQNAARFDVVILDLTIPGGMGGKEVIRKLLDVDPELKAIVSSGYACRPEITDYKEHGFKAVAAKPYDIQDLRRILQKVLGNDH